MILCIKNHLTEQKKKHAALDVEIQVMQLQPGHDGLALRKLKKKKLHLKENIERLENPSRATAPA